MRRCTMTRGTVSSRVAGGALVWLMLVAAPLTQVFGQQDVDEVDDGDIVLPTVILELDEPASGGLEVALPIDIQVLAPERWPPLPEAGDLDIDLRTAVAAPDIDWRSRRTTRPGIPWWQRPSSASVRPSEEERRRPPAFRWHTSRAGCR